MKNTNEITIANFEFDLEMYKQFVTLTYQAESVDFNGLKFNNETIEVKHELLKDEDEDKLAKLLRPNQHRKFMIFDFPVNPSKEEDSKGLYFEKSLINAFQYFVAIQSLFSWN